MLNRISKLYECRNCGGLVGSKQLACPYCDSSDGPTRTVGTVDGGTTEQQLAWYRVLEVDPDAI